MQIQSRLNVKKLRLLVPNTITLAAILAGYLSIIEMFSGQYVVAAWLILIACVLDMLDGRVARAMNATSEFGGEFDSLADMVNYGIAPALLFYLLYFNSWGLFGTALSFVPVACAGVRLARFNVTSDPDIPTSYFIGLPTTIAAVVMAGFVLFINGLDGQFALLATAQNVTFAAAILTVVIAFLMVSHVQYEKSNILSLRYIRKTRRVITGAVIVLSLVFFWDIAFFVWGLSYIMYGAGRSTYYTLRYGNDDVIETELDAIVYPAGGQAPPDNHQPDNHEG